MNPYTRPEPTPEMKSRMAQIATKINRLHNMDHRFAYILNLMVENYRLTLEVNERRAESGIAQLSIFDNDKARIA